MDARVKPAHDGPNKRPCALLSFPREHIRAKLKVVVRFPASQVQASPAVRDVPGRGIAIRRSAPLRRSASGCQNTCAHCAGRVRFRCTSESLEAHMTRLLLTVAFTAMLASHA